MTEPPIETTSALSFLASSLPPEIKLHIAKYLCAGCLILGNPDCNQDLMALSMTARSWRIALLPLIYSHCQVGSKGNFAIENWIARLLPHYGRFTKSIDVALCWAFTQWLPDRERELIELGHNSLIKRWETARDELISQLVAGLPNLTSVTITALRCITNDGPNDCLCLRYYGRAADAFSHKQLRFVTFHGIATSFCRQLAEPIITHSSQYIEYILFSDSTDGLPFSDQPFDLVCRLPQLKTFTLAASSLMLHDIGSLDWVCRLKELRITNEPDGQMTQALLLDQLDSLLVHFDSSLTTLVLQDVAIGRSSGSQRLPISNLLNLVLHSTRDVTFRTLEVFRSYRFYSLSITVISALQVSPLLDALSTGAFPKLKHIRLHFKESRGTPVCWGDSETLAVQAACDQRAIILVVTVDKRQKDPSAKVVRRHERPSKSR